MICATISGGLWIGNDLPNSADKKKVQRCSVVSEEQITYRAELFPIVIVELAGMDMNGERAFCGPGYGGGTAPG